MAGSSSDAEIARKTWEMENDIETIPASDEIFRYDAQEQQQFLSTRKFRLFALPIFMQCQLFGRQSIIFQFMATYTCRSVGKRSALL